MPYLDPALLMDNPITASRKLKSFLAQLLLAAMLFVVFLIPRIPGLDKFVTPDEPTWEKRSANFFTARLQKDYASTNQTGHPGVTTMWLGEITYRLKFPTYSAHARANTGDTWLFKIIEKYGPLPIELLAASRMLVVLVVSFICVVCFQYARMLLGLWPALMGFALLAFDPLPIAQSRVLHTNALMGSFMILATLAFMHFMQKRNWLSLVISGAAGGLGFITLSPGGFIVPVIICLALLEFASLRWDAHERKPRHWMMEIIVPLAAWGLIALLAIMIVWPAMWVDPIGTLTSTLRFAMGAAEGEIGTTQLLGAYQQSDEGVSRFFYYYPLTYLWRSTPVALIGLVLLVAMWRSNVLGKFSMNTRKNLLWLVVFAVIYTVAMSTGEKKYDRYYMPVYPVLNILSGAGWAAGLLWLTDRVKVIKNYRYAILGLGLVVLFQAVSASQTYPYYLTYYNPLLGGIQKAPSVMIVGWGEGLNEAVSYLRNIPGIENKTIHTWYPAAFSWFSRTYGFKAEFVDLTYEAQGKELARYLAADYVITYINQWQRNTHPNLLAELAKLTPVYIVVIDEVEYVRIYKMR